MTTGICNDCRTITSGRCWRHRTYAFGANIMAPAPHPIGAQLERAVRQSMRAQTLRGIR